MTVKKRPRPDGDDGVLDIPPALLQELEAMNARMGSNDPIQYIEAEEPQDRVREMQGVTPGPAILDEAAEFSYPEGAQPIPPVDNSEYRLEILGKAAHIVTRDRNVQYGPPENTFQRIANLWTAYLGDYEFLPTDVAAMLALLKIARLASNPVHEDSWVDLAGYAACGASSAKRLVEEHADDDDG